ncbi:MAG: hypothetical protein IPP44_14070 [Ideonella sp.]|nr:hypothetical protein [Ideonella sp.]
MPQRVPLWKKLLFDPLRRMPVILYPDGGSAMTTAEHVGQAIAGAVERGGDGERHPIGDENLTWDEMPHTMLDALGLQSASCTCRRWWACFFRLRAAAWRCPPWP